jgi:hypothetical protein
MPRERRAGVHTIALADYLLPPHREPAMAGAMTAGMSVMTRRCSAILMCLLLLSPLHARAADPGSPGAGSVVMGLGAIAGVVALNAAVIGIGGLPGGAAYSGAATLTPAMAVAVSRVYAVSSAVLGAWAGEYLYSTAAEEHTRAGRLASIGAGAIVGIAGFNTLTRPIGVLPSAAGIALDPLPVATVLGSRLVAVGSAGLGAIGATWAYDQVVGRETDLGYLFTLLGGAVAGVAVGNIISMGSVGATPWGAGVSQGFQHYGGAFASTAAAAASRVWVVGSGFAGVVAADWWYHGR